MPGFDHRSQDTEIMDDLLCAGEVVDQTLRELEFINRWLGGNQVTLKGIQLLLKNNPHENTVSIIDLGCGGGDILKIVAGWGRKNNIKTRLTGIDANPNIIAFALHHSKGYPEISYETTNIFSEEFRKRKFDIALATLFTHHFSDHELVDMLSSLQHQAKMGIVINDIHRHWFAFHSIQLLTQFFSKSVMVKFDAPLSVLRAFQRHELETILSKAGIHKYTLRWKWAFRWQLIIPTASPASP